MQLHLWLAGPGRSYKISLISLSLQYRWVQIVVSITNNSIKYEAFSFLFFLFVQYFKMLAYFQFMAVKGNFSQINRTFVPFIALSFLVILLDFKWKHLKLSESTKFSKCNCFYCSYFTFPNIRCISLTDIFLKECSAHVDQTTTPWILNTTMNHMSSTCSSAILYCQSP